VYSLYAYQWIKGLLERLDSHVKSHELEPILLSMSAVAFKTNADHSIHGI
jgi:hypothetical protein